MDLSHKSGQYTITSPIKELIYTPKIHRDTMADLNRKNEEIRYRINKMKAEQALRERQKQRNIYIKPENRPQKLSIIWRRLALTRKRKLQDRIMKSAWSILSSENEVRCTVTSIFDKSKYAHGMRSTREKSHTSSKLFHSASWENMER